MNQTQPSDEKPGREPGVCYPTIILLVTMMASTGMLVRWGMNPIVGFDEGWHAAIAYLQPLWIALQTASADTHPFLYYLLLRPLFLFDAHPFALRLLSIIPALLTLPLLFALLRRLRIDVGITLITIVVLALSFSFNQMGVMVRSYALTTFLLLGGVWFWLDMLADGPGRPSRRAAVSSLALFTAAFWCLYAAAFVTTAIIASTLAVMALSPRVRRQTWQNWRQYSHWPEWLLFFVLHALGVGWFLFGRIHERAVDLPPGHVVQWLAPSGAGAIDYLVTGLRQEIALFTPLMDMPVGLQNLVLVLLPILIIGLNLAYRRRGNAALALLSLMPLLLTLILALLGLLRAFPFGGELRHQYVLFPFLLLLLPLTLNLLWPHLQGIRAKYITALLIIAIALHTSYRSHQAWPNMGEANPVRWWDDETRLLFSKSSTIPVLLPRYSFYTVLVNLLVPGSRFQTSWMCDDHRCVTAPQGLRAVLADWPDFQQHRVWLADNGTTDIFKSREWLIAVHPNDAFFSRLRGLMTAVDITEIRILSPASSDVLVDQVALRVTARRNGFELTGFHRSDDALIWQLAVAGHRASATPTDPPSANSILPKKPNPGDPP